MSDNDCNRESERPDGVVLAAAGLADSQPMNARQATAQQKICADLSIFFLHKHMGRAEAFAYQVFLGGFSYVLGCHVL